MQTAAKLRLLPAEFTRELARINRLIREKGVKT